MYKLELHLTYRQQITIRFIFYFLLSAGIVSSTLPSEITPLHTLNDKLRHFTAFVFLTWCAHLAHIDWRTGKLIALMSAYGALIEILQYFIPYRSAEWADLSADMLGILLYSFALIHLLEFKSKAA